MGLDDVEIEYIAPKLDEEDNVEEILRDDESQWKHYQGVFDRFAFKDEEEDDDEEDADASATDFLAATMGRKVKGKTAEVDEAEKEESDEEEEEEKRTVSAKQHRTLGRPTLAALKTWCHRPEVVEVWDCTAADPRMLVWLKAYRNTIQVPPHWSQKRKYMQGKRGIDKAPFRLPDYIEATKISEIRSALQQRDAAKTIKQKQREKARPKMHRMDIDYEVLHDAFFKYATKPKMTKFGDMYYEGKELELRMRKFETGQLSERLKEALGMGDNAPPPWLINMQRYGPPPSYPAAKIPGLNAPIPAGAQYGYHPGGWGKPPVDEFGRPLYGDYSLDSREEVTESVDSKFWGELGSDDEEEEEVEEQPAAGDVSSTADGVRTPASITTSGMDTPALLEGSTSIASLGSIGTDLRTPRSLDIRKRGFDSATMKPYTVLHEQRAPVQPRALFQSNTIYRMPGGEQKPLLGGCITPLGGNITPAMGPGISSVGPGGVVTPYTTGGGPLPLVGGTVTPYVSGVASVGGVVTPHVGGTISFSGGAITPQVEAAKRKADAEPENTAATSGSSAAAASAPKKKKNKKEFKF